MKNFQLLLITFFTTTLGFSQVTVCLGTDATVCQGQTVQITNCGGAGGGTTGGIFLTNPTSVPLSDDNWSGSIPIGFPFSFYGTTYNNLVIGANGIVSFNTANAGGYCPWSLNGSPLPNTSVTAALNSAMVCYQDLNPANASSGPVQYQLMGTAPNRTFVVLYNGVTMFSCTSSCSYIGYVFREGSNIIEMFIGSKGACSTWNGGLAVQGTENNPGTVAHITPGRNNSAWTATQDGRRWTPTAPNNTSSYTMASIPYVNINGPGGALQWQNTLGQTFPYNNGVLNINQVPPNTTGYFLTGTSCGVSIGSVSDTTFITRTSATVTATSTTDFCSGGSGTATANPLPAANGPYTYVWTPSGQTSQTATGLVTGTYQVVATSAFGCNATATVVVPDATATFAGTTTLVSCPGGSDGTATATMTPEVGTISYLWDDPAAQTTQTASGLAAGTYNCTITSSSGCVGTVTVTVTEIPGMVGQIITQQDPSCNSGSDGVIEVNITGGTPASGSVYTYAWDNSASTTNIANDLAVGPHTVTITDINGCVITMSATLGQPASLQIVTLSPDTIICPENNTVLQVTGTGGSSDYIFTWTENGTEIGTGTSITVDPETSGNVYCVTMSEVCGSPTTDSCLTITFPTKIVPAFVSDLESACQPGTFVFTNTSNNQTEIATVFLEFGDGKDTLLMGYAGTPHTYENAQDYDLRATITSTQGCVTISDLNDMVTVIAKPEADFNFSSNPTTYFETEIIMQDKSSAGVVSWEWYSPGSEPAASTAKNPTFKFPDGVVGTYPVRLVVTTPEGCIDTTEHILTVNSDILFFAPTAFTPDGDEFNQTWDFSVIGIDIYNFELMIFDRWGEMIWETHDVNSSWDGTYHGKIVPTGAYTWIAKVKALDTDGKQTFTGYFNLFR